MLKKTNFIIFGNKKKQTKLDLKINNVSIDRVQCTKFLGVYVDEKLNWDFHLNIIQKKISKCIGILHRVKYKLGENLKLVLYFTLMLPYLSYCCAIWGNTYISRLNKLIVLQKRAIRLIANVPYLAILHHYYINITV